MPPTGNKRPMRARKDVNQNVDVPDSSPSRPSKRRKKSDKEKVEPEPEPEPELTPEPAELPLDRSGVHKTDDELIAALVPHLQMPAHFVQASQDHANALYEKHNKEGVQAYAKLAGKDWTFYVKNLNNVIGRPPEGSGDATDKQGVHIDLGPSKMVSRLHADIYFDSDTEAWNLQVQGRNGLRIDNLVKKKGEKIPLVSGQVIEVGGIEMMFVLPQGEGSLHVNSRYLFRAGLIQAPEEEDKGDETEAPTSSQLAASAQSSRGQNGAGPLPIAPAPPDYKRPGTPTSARTKTPYSNTKSPFITGGTMLMNADDVDLTLDSNSHIKPSYSYAQLISQAILNSDKEACHLSGIYSYIMGRYSYYRVQHGGGWQNSIRHNLSLNKNFYKISRDTDEPGKGMKWCIRPEVRDDMAKTSVRNGRGGHRGSSAPNSPAHFNNLTRVTKDGDHNPSSTIKPNQRSPNSDSPPDSSYPANAPQFTPDRGGRLSMQTNIPGDGSPLPRHRRSNNNSFGISDNVPGSPPVLSSSYLQEDIGSMVTPAPSRVHPHLAPPSTAQRPSQHMPTSSPAPFWRYADIGNTPMKGPSFDVSPTKTVGAGLPPSSPPPFNRPSAASPVRNGGASEIDPPIIEEPDEEEGGFDLTRGFQSISSYHAPIGNGASTTSTVNGRS